MAAFLRDPKVLKFDLIAIQEPWQNKFQSTTHFPNSQQHHLIYPDQADIGSKEPRVCFYVNKRLDMTNISVHFGSRDIISLEIQLEKPDPHHQENCLWVHNVYNEPNVRPAPALTKLRSILAKRDESEDYREDLIVGDLNIHHPQWGGPISPPITGASSSWTSSMNFN